MAQLAKDCFGGELLALLPVYLRKLFGLLQLAFELSHGLAVLLPRFDQLLTKLFDLPILIVVHIEQPILQIFSLRAVELRCERVGSLF